MAEEIASTKDTADVNPANIKQVKNNTDSMFPQMPITENTLGNAINARPIPPDATLSIDTPWLVAMNPSIAKTPMADKNSKPQLAKAVMNALLFISVF